MPSEVVSNPTLLGGTGLAALLFASTFLYGGRLRPLVSEAYNHRSAMSFAAGTSVAYVFVQLMPEMHEYRTDLVDSVDMRLPKEGLGIYFLALIGFLGFYGLDHLRARVCVESNASRERASFNLHVGGFALYVWLMAYLLVDNLAPSTMQMVLSAGATAIHFVAVDHALREEHGERYERMGRYLLAAASLAGWATGLTLHLPDHILALLVSFLSGAIIVNSSIMELPSEKDGRFLPFIVGGVTYGAMLVSLG